MPFSDRADRDGLDCRCQTGRRHLQCRRLRLSGRRDDSSPITWKTKSSKRNRSQPRHSESISICSSPTPRRSLELAMKHRIRAVSYGRAPDKTTMRRLKDAGVDVHADRRGRQARGKAIELGADVITVQGQEGGGHTGGRADFDPASRRCSTRCKCRWLRRADSVTAAVWPPRWPTARRESRWAPAS